MAQWPYGTANWQRLRKLKLGVTPGCEVCTRQGRLKWASVVDHVTPINKGGDPFPSLDGLMSLCAECHNHKTRREQLGEPGVIKGTDLNGWPLDAAHEFYGITPCKDDKLAGQERIGTKNITNLPKRVPPWA